jgi:predicted cytidylate kinase
MKHVIAIAGPSGSGKSTVADALAKKLGWMTIDTGLIFREMAKKQGMSVIEFGKYAEKNPEIDRKLDSRLAIKVKSAKKSIILQGRLSAWTCEKSGIPAKKFWITAKIQTRASRIAKREGLPYLESLRNIAKRDRDNRSRYIKTYGLDLSDLSVYDAVVDTSSLNVDQVVSAIIKKLPKVWLTK